MSLLWKNKSERGSAFMMRLIRWIALYLHRQVARVILFPICIYYYFFTPSTRPILKLYWSRILTRKVTSYDFLKHYFYFASTILDRLFFISKQYQQFDLNITGHQSIQQCIEANTGCIMLGSHLGSFESIRCLARDNINVPIRIVMDNRISETMSRLIMELDPELKEAIIDATDPTSIFLLHETLQQGGFVGMLGDRVIDTKNTVSCNFLGKTTQFPTGPLLLASITQVPVNLFFGIYCGGNRYTIIFERFADKIELQRDTRQEDLLAWVEKYVARLEYYVKKYPYNWFNFYDFWHEQTNA